MASFDASSELTMNIALCACGALGYYMTKWANRRLFQVRLPAQKVLISDEEEALCASSSIDREDPGRRAEACEPESEPATLAVVASSVSSRKARRRSARQAKAAEAAVVQEAAAPNAANCGGDADEQEHAEDIEAAKVETAEATEAGEAEEPAAWGAADEVPIFDVSLPETVATDVEEAPKAQQDEEEEEEEEQPVVSDRVSRLLAKKAARKERKAQERQHLAEQLAAAAVENTEVEEETDLLPAEPETQRSDMLRSAASAFETAPDATAEQEGEEEKEEEDVEKEEHADAPAGVKAKESEGEEIADAVETDAEASEHEEATDEVEADNSDRLQAFGLSSVTYTPIMSPDGQQLYTDGQQVFIMACVQLDDAVPSNANIDADAVAEAAASVNSPDSVIAITDPSSPWHRVALDLGVTSQVEEKLLAALSPGVQPLAAAMGPPPVSMPPLMAPQVIEPNPDVDVLGFPAPPLRSGFPAALGARCPPMVMEPTLESDEEDMLWDICWELIV